MEKILADFKTKDAEPTSPHARQCVTIWVSPEAKARYDRLQEISGRQFSKKARELLLAAIEMAEARAG